MADPPPLNTQVSTNPLSPGVVENDECLIREVCDPDHIDEDGMVVESAIQTKDLLSQGFSVHRRQHTTRDFIKQVVRDRCLGPGREDWKEEVAIFKAREVRLIRDDNEQAVFVVRDTPSEDNPGHASIYLAPPQHGGGGPAYARKMKRRLTPFLQRRMSVDEAFERCPSPNP